MDLSGLAAKQLSSKVSAIKGNLFPYLDLALYWTPDGSLQFKVYMKENQLLKYLNKGSCHTKSCMKAIPNGVFNRLAKLTSSTRRSREAKINDFPQHF